MFAAEKTRVRMDEEQDVLDKCSAFLALLDKNNAHVEEDGTAHMLKKMSSSMSSRVSSRAARMAAQTAGGIVRPPLGMRACRWCGELSEMISKVAAPLSLSRR